MNELNIFDLRVSKQKIKKDKKENAIKIKQNTKLQIADGVNPPIESER